MDSVPAMRNSELGGEEGLIGSVGSLTLVVWSPEKFLMAMIIESRCGT